MGWQDGDRKRNITKIVESAAVAVLLFVLFRAFFGIAYVSGESMEPVTGRQEGSEIRLSSGQYFLIGDNQDISLDTRTFGCIGRDAVYGIVICKLL